MYSFFRKLLFYLDAENAHYLVMGLSSFGFKFSPLRRSFEKKYRVEDPCLRQLVHGIEFANPVGLAAGFDKNAQFLNVLPNFGFASIEIGTVTGVGQPGNDRPRLFRLPKDYAILNRMGFNNHGCEEVAKRLQSFYNDGEKSFVLGVNIGKSKVVELDDADTDYLKSFDALYRFAQYMVVNVSSPNTPNLRELQEKSRLLNLLQKLQTRNRELAEEAGGTPKPMFVKVAPDLTNEALLDVIEVVREVGLQGIIATNTTISRAHLQTTGVEELGPGGISGKPLRERSLEVIRFLHQNAPDITIIGVGGIFTSDDALRVIRAGATLIQVWTGFIYQGPGIVCEINRGLAKACQENGWNNIQEAIGLDVRKTPTTQSMA